VHRQVVGHVPQVQARFRFADPGRVLMMVPRRRASAPTHGRCAIRDGEGGVRRLQPDFEQPLAKVMAWSLTPPCNAFTLPSLIRNTSSSHAAALPLPVQAELDAGAACGRDELAFQLGASRELPWVSVRHAANI